MNANIRQCKDDHYEMPLPVRQDFPSLPNNRSASSLCLKHLEKRLSRDQNYYTKYTVKMNGLLQPGNAEPVNEADSNKGSVW